MRPRANGDFGSRGGSASGLWTGAGRCPAAITAAMAAALCAGVALTAVPARAGSLFGGSAPVPDWVKTAVQQKLPDLHGNPKAVVLLDETTYTVNADGHATEHERCVVKILRPQGRKYGLPFVAYDKDSKVTSMHVWSIDPAGHEYTEKDSEISDVGEPGEGGELYSDERAKVADPPGRDPGGIVAYEYVESERPYLAETNWEFQDDLPRINQSFTLVLPEGFTYTTTWAHHNKVDAIDLEHQQYRWEMNDQAGIDLEQVPMSPPMRSLTARMTVHYQGPGLAEPQDGTWQGIGEWYAGLEGDRLAPPADVAAMAAQLTVGKTDFYDKAEAITEFMQ